MKMYACKIVLFVLIVSAVFLHCKKTQPCIDFDKVNPAIVCDNSYNPVCGCDDVTYQNQCHAERNGVVAWIGGPCP
jgi:hypothetical protein